MRGRESLFVRGREGEGREGAGGGLVTCVESCR